MYLHILLSRLSPLLRSITPRHHLQGVAAKLLGFPVGSTTVNIRHGNTKLGKGSIEVQTALEVYLCR